MSASNSETVFPVPGFPIYFYNSSVDAQRFGNRHVSVSQVIQWRES